MRRQLRAATRWVPSAQDLAEGRAILVKELSRPELLTFDKFAVRADRSIQDLERDCNADPPRLLVVSASGLPPKVPDWQLTPRGLVFTRAVLAAADQIDAWTMYFSLSRPMDALDGITPVDAALGCESEEELSRIVVLVCAALGVQSG